MNFSLQTTSPKPLDQLQTNFTGMFIWWSSFKLFKDLMPYYKWPLLMSYSINSVLITMQFHLHCWSNFPQIFAVKYLLLYCHSGDRLSAILALLFLISNMSFIINLIIIIVTNHLNISYLSVNVLFKFLLFFSHSI